MGSDQYFHSGKYKLETVPHEMKMTHWVYAPVLTCVESKVKILDLSGSIWDLRSAIENSKEISLMLARYPDGNKEYQVTHDLAKGKALVNGKLILMNSIREALDAIV